MFEQPPDIPADNVDALIFGPVLGAPPPGDWNKSQLIDHVKTAMAVELGTIPIYFCALYSIIRDGDGWGSKARAHILSVAEQEMLHLGLAGNMLVALGEKPKLYNKSFMPTYPASILYDKIPMRLAPADKENLECFLKIEAPFQAPPKPPVQPTHGLLMMVEMLNEYKSIGEFYKGLETGILELSAKEPDLFSGGRENQLTGDEFFDSAMTVIVDKASALEALNTIVDQGEGGIGVPESHYTVFVELYHQRKKWACVNYVDEPHTADYKGVNEIAYRLSRAVDASYCYLLQTFQRCWGGEVAGAAQRTQLLRNIHRLMISVLSPLAHALVKQPVPGGRTGKSRFAAPCFEFYGRASHPGVPFRTAGELFRALKGEVEAARRAAERAGDTDAAGEIERIEYCLNGFVGWM
ncbi:ferritin-like-domain-containing protein [Trametes meyenii]|nr:ferritin-like-domain-containing protein [Trametes meyenii]